MRLFIALNLPKKERQRIYRAVRPMRDEALPVRWLDLDTFHLTLKFLGEVRREDIPVVEEAMQRVAQSTKPFSAKVGGFGAFPTIRRPRVLWVGVEACPELRCLKQDLEWTLGACGFEAETRAFHPHITLGRARDARAGAFRGLDSLMASLDFEGTMNVRSLELMRSHLSPEGARYSVLSSARLQA